MYLPGWFLLIAAALTLRGGAAALRPDASSALRRCAGWLLAATAAWLAAGAAGAWTPLWPALPVAALGIVDRGGRSLMLWAGSDAALVIGLGLLSVPMLAPAHILAAAVALAAAGLGLDLILGRCTAPLRRAARWIAAAITVGVVAFLGFALMPPIGPRAPRDWGEMVSLSSGIGPSTIPGERAMTLETGAIAWFSRPPGDEPLPGALMFHGANPEGAHQPAAIAARRALLHAGFAVLAVDRPGYGASPYPALDADLTAWDPLPTAIAAHRALGEQPGVRGITAVGHSMGTLEVLGLLSAGVPLDAAVIMGGGLAPPGEAAAEEDQAYWDRRFLSDRGLASAPESFPVREIRQRYLDNRRYLLDLPAGHAPVRLVNFGVEWPNVVAGRDRLYELLPGRKEIWELPDTTHYLSTEDWGRMRLMIGDTRATRRLAAGLARLRRNPRSAGRETAGGPGPILALGPRRRPMVSTRQRGQEEMRRTGRVRAPASLLSRRCQLPSVSCGARMRLPNARRGVGGSTPCPDLCHMSRAAAPGRVSAEKARAAGFN